MAIFNSRIHAAENIKRNAAKISVYGTELVSAINTCTRGMVPAVCSPALVQIKFNFGT